MDLGRQQRWIVVREEEGGKRRRGKMERRHLGGRKRNGPFAIDFVVHYITGAL